MYIYKPSLHKTTSYLTLSAVHFSLKNYLHSVLKFETGKVSFVISKADNIKKYMIINENIILINSRSLLQYI